MSVPIFKKEFIINYPHRKVRESILKIYTAETNYYELIKDDLVLNEIRLLQKGKLLDAGYHIDFILTRISESETKVEVEVTRNFGTIQTIGEVSVANNIMKSVTSKLSAFISDNVDPVTGKAIIPHHSCLFVFLIIIGAFTIGTYSIIKLFTA